jgi:hypothetical protein
MINYVYIIMMSLMCFFGNNSLAMNSKLDSVDKAKLALTTVLTPVISRLAYVDTYNNFFSDKSRFRASLARTVSLPVCLNMVPVSLLFAAHTLRNRPERDYQFSSGSCDDVAVYAGLGYPYA